MKFIIKERISDIIRLPFFCKNDYCLFKRNHRLEKRNENNELIWISEPINFALATLRNKELIFIFQFGELFIINQENGHIMEKIVIPFFPLYVDDDIIYGEAVIEGDKYIVKNKIGENTLASLFQIEEREYCRFIYNNYALVGEKIEHRIFSIRSLFTGETLWEYRMDKLEFSLQALFFKNILIKRLSDSYSAFDLETGTQIWHKPINIDAFDEEKGLIYVLENDFIVIDATTGEEIIRVKDWSKKQLDKYPALFFGGSPCSLSEEYIVFSSRATFDEFGEGGIFFIDKETAEVKEYFRIVFDKDPVQRTGWSGNKIPDDQQIPFMPLDKPIYKNGRLYVLLPSPIEGQKDLYIYERESRC